MGETRCEQLVGALSGGSTVLSFFGVGFGGGETAIRIMAVGEVVNVLTGYGGLVLVMTGNERGFTVSVVSGTIVNLALSAVLIPPLGISGAAMATATGVAVTNLWASRLVWQRLQVWTPVLPPWPRTRLAQRNGRH
ncbi:MAG: polysaccharide biosynthesis C-terminal domain-containing protein [Actinobacteria bacterium]|nr:polysaccharide biosynthesis C-terminal domain-containing protein [Actinomycetota bacterium]